MVCIVKKLGCRKRDTIWYSDPIFGMHVLINDKGELDIADLCKMHLGVYVYEQDPLSQTKYYDDPIEGEELNPEDIVNLEE